MFENYQKKSTSEQSEHFVEKLRFLLFLVVEKLFKNFETVSILGYENSHQSFQEFFKNQKKLKSQQKMTKPNQTKNPNFQDF